MKGLLAYNSKDAGAELSTKPGPIGAEAAIHDSKSTICCEYETKYTAEDGYAAFNPICQVGAERHLWASLLLPRLQIGDYSRIDGQRNQFSAYPLLLPGTEPWIKVDLRWRV